MSDFVLREARTSDLEAIVRLYAADTLGGHDDAWTDETAPAYAAAFARIVTSEDHRVFVAEAGGRIVGTFQVSVIPCLVDRGATRVRIESVHVDPARRSQGIGTSLVAHAEAWAREHGAAFVELASNASRVDAHRFYGRLGYGQTHLGFKKVL
ncbi:GNAT family N-acetyltransferase [Salinarimonas chemoclinalis]|uniref:GNAT family N-acetyltransferase n=1 Tax=Salinarimonas chemoclinalis TaxID=3241599 RepID=UPI003558B992